MLYIEQVLSIISSIAMCERESLSVSGSELWCFPLPHLSVSIGAYVYTV